MCFVLDANSFPCVFNPKDKYHEDFKPVLDWLYSSPDTSLVYGGTKYKKELRKMNHYLSILLELKRSRKANEIDPKIIDKKEAEIKAKVTKNDLNDPHIIAIFCASGCLLFVSKDKRADEYIKNPELYPKKQKVPKIYRCKEHQHLLKPEKIVKLQNVCK